MAILRRQHGVRVWNSSVTLDSATEAYVLYVAQGTCGLQLENQEIRLGPGEAFVLNCRQKARAQLEPGSLLAAVSIDYAAVCQLAGEPRLRFSMEESDPEGRWYGELKRQVESLLMAHTQSGAGSIFQELAEFNQLLRLLVQHFVEPEGEPPEGDKGQQLLALLQSEGDLSLQELASRMYLSLAAVSRLFKKVTGENYSQYKRRARLEQVRWELTAGQKPITSIALEAGFTSSTVFNRTFKEAFGVTPSQYRKEAQERDSGQEDGGKALRQVQQLLEERRALGAEKKPVQRVEASALGTKPLALAPTGMLTLGPAALLREANVQNQVALLARRLEIQYLRMWSLFSPQMVQGDGWEAYQFSNIDSVLDFCVDHGLTPHLDLAQHRDFSLASESTEIYSRQSQARHDWFRMLDEFLQHLRRRYTEEVASRWVYEFTFFLNDTPYIEQDGLSNLEVWKRGWRLVKSILPQARVAGPGLLCGNRLESIRLVHEFAGCGCPPDIFTTTHYPYSYSQSLEQVPIFQQEMQKVSDPNFLVGQVGLLRRELASCGFQGELWVTDWGISLANRNYLNDSCYRGAAILDHTLRVGDLADRMGIFCVSDVLSAYGDAGNVLSGSLGLLSQTGIRKPAYYAYRFLHQLGRYRLAQSPNCVVTAETPNELRILCYNHKALGPKYYLMEENSHRPDGLNGLFEDLDPLEMEIVLRDLPRDPGPYFVRQRILNEKTGGPLSKWVALGCVPNLTRDDLEFLERTSVPQVALEKREAVGGTITLRFTMEPNELRVITIA